MRAVGLKATGAVGSACNKNELCAVIKAIGNKLIFAVFTEQRFDILVAGFYQIGACRMRVKHRAPAIDIRFNRRAQIRVVADHS